MRTTLKRGVGRGADLNNGTNGHAVFPPASVSSVSRYRQPPSTSGRASGSSRRILLGVLLVVFAVGLAAAGAALLWYHETVSGLRAHSTRRDQVARSS